jgi:tetratricopeptide (TPR) repeat protein
MNRPGNFDIHQQMRRAVELHSAGRLPEAEAIYRSVLSVQPNNPSALHLLGVLAHGLTQHDLAAQLIERAVAINPKDADAFSNLSMVYRALHRYDEAIKAGETAVRLNAKLAEAHNNLAAAHLSRHAPDRAAACARMALSIQPRFAKAHRNLGQALLELNRSRDAIVEFQQSLSLEPDKPDALISLALAQRESGRTDLALAACERAVAIEPDNAAAHWQLAMALLTSGDLRRGFCEYEWRWRCSEFTSPNRNFPQPQWDGGDLSGKTILLHAEQGFGDSIQMIRYAPLVRDRGGRVIVLCRRELAELFASVNGIEQRIIEGETLPAFDLHVPLMSLPAAMGTTLQTIPNIVPYVRADPASIEQWKQKLAATSGKRVGLVWLGSVAFGDQRRQIDAAMLHPLRTVAGVTFVSLQKPPAGAPVPMIDLTSELNNFGDTAALVMNLDLVICCDTAVAHLAGALGKPTWLLLPTPPEWRWMQTREDSPWYPTMRLFRQPTPGDWRSVVTRVCGELDEFVKR